MTRREGLIEIYGSWLGVGDARSCVKTSQEREIDTVIGVFDLVELNRTDPLPGKLLIGVSMRWGPSASRVERLETDANALNRFACDNRDFRGWMQLHGDLRR